MSADRRGAGADDSFIAFGCVTVGGGANDGGDEERSTVNSCSIIRFRLRISIAA